MNFVFTENNFVNQKEGIRQNLIMILIVEQEIKNKIC